MLNVFIGNCGYTFCFTCKEEAHKPADCNTVAQWNEKNCAESENILWIKANTKKCPKCRKPIEKNQGCNHMTCKREVGGCGYEFCWICLGDWTKHGSETGGYYKCNRFMSSEEKEALKSITDSAELAKHAVCSND